MSRIDLDSRVESDTDFVDWPTRSHGVVIRNKVEVAELAGTHQYLLSIRAITPYF